MPVVIGFFIALGIFPWMILIVHMYVYHWRKPVDGVALYEKARADHLDEFSRFGCLQGWDEPPPAPAGPAAYCGACARSGVGACDDYPDCPAGRHEPQ